MLIIVFVLLTSKYVDASPRLPGGVTCEQIVRFASDLNIPNTWRGRRQAQIIALTFGIVVTNAQLDAAAQCLKSASARSVQ
jgi:hypothetical protein